jgi:hypothetical protein
VQDSLLTTDLEVELGALVSAAEAQIAGRIDESLAPPEATDESDEAESSAASGELPYATWTSVPEGGQVRARVWRGSSYARLDQDGLRVEMELRFMAALRREGSSTTQGARTCGCDGRAWCGGGGNPPRRAVAVWTVPLSVSPDWALTGTPSFELKSIERCPLPVGRSRIFDPTEELLRPLVHTGDRLGGELAALIAGFEGLRALAEPLWRGLATPVPIEGDKHLALLLRPRAMRAGALELRGDLARVPVRFAVSPMLGSPASDKVESVAWPPPAGVRGATGFRIASELIVPLRNLEEQLQQRFGGRRYPDPGLSNSFIEVSSVQLYGSDSQAVIQVNLEGSARGEVFLVGRVVATGESERLQVEDLDITPESLDALSLLYDEVERGDHEIQRTPRIDPGRLREEMAQTAQWSLHGPMTTLRRQVQVAARRSVTPGHSLVLAMKDGSFVNVAMDGDAARGLVVMNAHAVLQRDAKPSTER